MPTLLSDPPFALYAILVLGVLASFAVWFNERNRKSLLVFGCFAGLLALLVVIDSLSESPREEAVRRVKDMARAIDARDQDAFLGNIADTLEYQGEGVAKRIPREDLRKSSIWSLLNQFGVNHVAAWAFDRDDVKELSDNAIEIGFLGKAEADGKQAPMYFRATFTREADGKWRLSKLASFDPFKRTNEQKSIPNFP
jgi:hypothetical protein